MRYKFVTLYGGKGNQIFQLLHCIKLVDNDSSKEKKIFIILSEHDPDIYNYLVKKNIRFFVINNNFIKCLYQISKLKFLRKILSISVDNDMKSNCFFHIGYWQYFDKKNIDIINDMFGSKLNNSVMSIHIRQGDYLTKKNKKIYEELDASYYVDKILELKGNTEIKNVNLISNGKVDRLLFKTIMDVFPKACITDCSMLSSDECFNIMLSSKYNIISNSTFSLVASLYMFDDKYTVYPKYWFKKNVFNYSILPNHDNINL